MLSKFLMTRSRFLLCLRLILLTLCLCEVNAQTYNYRHYSVEHGLASTTVYMVCQDAKGYMWFGTEAGVSRFDGKVFTTFTIDDGLSDNEILRIHEDSKGRIWFFAFNGHLSFYQDGKIHNEKTDPYLAGFYNGAAFLSFFEDSKGRLWFGRYNNTVSILDGVNVKTIILPNPAPDAGVIIEEIPRGTILISHMDTQFKYTEYAGKVIPVKTIAGAANGCYFRGLSGATYYYHRGIFKSFKGETKMILDFNETPGLNGNLISSITDDGTRVFICGGNNGVICLDSSMKFNNNTRYYLKGVIVNTLFTDDEKNIWFATREDGVYVLPIQSAEVNIYKSPVLKDEHVYSVSKDDEGNIWLGCGGNYLSCISNDSVVNHFLPVRTNVGRILFIEKDKEGYMWCGGDYELFKIIKRSPFKKIQSDEKKIDSFPTGRSLSVCFNSTNDGYATTPYYGLQISNNHGADFESFFTSQTPNKDIRNFCAFYDNTDRLFQADGNGLNEIKNNKLFPVAPKDSRLRSRIVCIRQAADSALIIATDGNGLLFLKNEMVINQLSKDNGLASNTCRKIYVSGTRIYACTANGLTAFTYINNTLSEFVNYNTFNGLVSNDVRDVFADKEFLYVAALSGLSVMKPLIEEQHSYPPRIYINNVLNNAKTVNWEKTFSVPYDNKLFIRFIAVTFAYPGGITYQYSLNKGSSINWITTSVNEIDIPRLPSGGYNFMLRAKKIDSDWSLPLIFSFSVTPPFYSTWWFVSAMVLIGLSGVGVVGVYLNRRSIRKRLAAIERNAMLNQERSRISTDMHDDLGSDFSHIAVIAELAKVSLTDKAESQALVQKISDHVQNSRSKMDEIIWALNPSHDSTGNLVSYCNEFCFNYFEGSGIRVQISEEKDIPDIQLNARQRRNLFLVIKEIAHNTLKHSGASNFYLQSQLRDNVFIISTKDDGVGFNLIGQKNRNGLRNIRNRLKEIDGQISIQTNPGSGTVIYISMVIKKN